MRRLGCGAEWRIRMKLRYGHWATSLRGMSCITGGFWRRSTSGVRIGLRSWVLGRRCFGCWTLLKLHSSSQGSGQAFFSWFLRCRARTVHRPGFLAEALAYMESEKALKAVSVHATLLSVFKALSS